MNDTQIRELLDILHGIHESNVELVKLQQEYTRLFQTQYSGVERRAEEIHRATLAFNVKHLALLSRPWWKKFMGGL